MDIYILGKDYSPKAILDEYQSFIWVDKYNEAGVFEIITGNSYSWVETGMYIRIADSNKLMIIENTIVSTDTKNGTLVYIRGRSLLSILDRRIIGRTRELKGNLQTAMLSCVTDTVVNPSNTNRLIPKFRVIPSKDTRITSLKIDSQVTGAYVYDILTTLCKQHNIGISVTLNPKDMFMELRLYMGEDRTRKQSKNLPILFSPDMNNLYSSTYIENSADHKNMAYVFGEGEGRARRFSLINNGVIGLDRRELFVDARDLTSEREDGSIMSNSEYSNLLISRGKEKLPQYKWVKDFEGEIENTPQWELNRDFFLGDLVELENEYGHRAYTRISEIIISEDDQNGYLMIPTFRPDDKKEDE